MDNKGRDVAHCLDAARRQLATARDGLSDAKSHPERKERGLRVAIEFGRGVGEALRHLKGRVHDYEGWWTDVKDSYLSNPVCAYLYNLRNDIFHEGTLNTGRGTYIRDGFFGSDGVTIDGKYYRKPPGAHSFVMGDSTGRDGWIRGPGHTVTDELHFTESGTRPMFEDAPAEFRYRPAVDAVAFWLDRLDDVLNDAGRKFG